MSTLQRRKQVIRGTNVISDDGTESQMAMDIVGNNASDGSEIIPAYPSIAYFDHGFRINPPTVVDEEEPRFPVVTTGMNDRRSSPTSSGYTDGSHRATIAATPPDVVVVTSPNGVSAPEPDVAMEAPIPRTSTYDDRGDVQLFAHPSPSVNAQPHLAPFEMSSGGRSYVSSRWTWKRRPHFRRTVEITWFRLAIFVIILAVLLTTAGLLGRYCSQGDASTRSQPQGGEAPGEPSVSTLDSIKARGSLVCGVVANFGFSMFNETTQTWSGFDVDLCRAIGAAVFENSGDHVIFENLTLAERFIALQNGKVDVLAAQTTYTMERDLYEPTAKAGFTFSVPYLYSLSFAGQPQFVDCADRLSSSGNCSNLQICVHDGTTHVGIVKDLFPGSVIKLAPSRMDFYNNFVQGHCNVLAGEQFDLAAINVRQAGYSSNYSFSKNLYSKEPLALVTRDDDVEWSDFVNWVLLAMLTAENQTISLQTAQNVIESPGPTVDLSLLWSYQAIAAVGNYAEMYDRHLQSIVPRASVNKQNNGTSPLIYSFPFGSNATNSGLGPVANGTLDKIKQRGYLVCGIGGEIPFFSTFNYSTHEWEGFDVDYCTAVSAAIFNGKVSTYFVEVSTAERFEVLGSGKVDVLSCDTTLTYERDVNESATFTQQNFYTGVQFGGVPPYGDCADRQDVSSSNCKGLRICVANGTTTVNITRKLFPDKYIAVQDSDQQVYDCLNTSRGNVIAGDGYYTAKATAQAQGYNRRYQTSSKFFSRENLAVVLRQDDPQWSSFVFWVVSATFYAAEQNITQSNYNLMPTVNFFGTEYSTMLQDAIRAVGSYDEIIARNVGDKYPVSPMNRVNKNPLGPQHFPSKGLFGLD